MNSEMSREAKRIGEGRKKLLELEREGKYLFHGSPDIIDVLEPRQAYTYNEEVGQDVKDGSPAVFATPYADAAIFRALIRCEGVEGDSENKFGVKEGGTLHFTVSRKLIDAAKLRTARIYVLDKTGFSAQQGTDSRIEKAVKPIRTIEVTVDDLPDYMTVVE